jgi:hypothetical protein
MLERDAARVERLHLALDVVDRPRDRRRLIGPGAICHAGVCRRELNGGDDRSVGEADDLALRDFHLGHDDALNGGVDARRAAARQLNGAKAGHDNEFEGTHTGGGVHPDPLDMLW